MALNLNIAVKKLVMETSKIQKPSQMWLKDFDAPMRWFFRPTDVEVYLSFIVFSFFFFLSSLQGLCASAPCLLRFSCSFLLQRYSASDRPGMLTAACSAVCVRTSTFLDTMLPVLTENVFLNVKLGYFRLSVDKVIMC